VSLKHEGYDRMRKRPPVKIEPKSPCFPCVLAGASTPFSRLSNPPRPVSLFPHDSTDRHKRLPSPNPSETRMKGDNAMSPKEKENLEEQKVPCCPNLKTDGACDVLQYQYRLLHPTTVTVANQPRNVHVEVVLSARFERCPGPLALGDLVYSTTLLPGEKVRLFTMDRRSRFTYDAATKVSYRNQQTQEEHYYMSSMSEFMSDLSVKDSGRSKNTTKGHFDTHGETSSILGSIFGSPSVDVSGNYNGESTSEFMRELTQHARASHYSSERATRAASSVSIGEVQTRTHIQTESQDHFESASREFSNPNKCHAVTFYFYRINKTQTIKFLIESIERRIVDSAADTRVTNNPFSSRGDISVIPSSVLATDMNRLEVENLGRASAAMEQKAETSTGAAATTYSAMPTNMVAMQVIPQPLSSDIRQQALTQVDRQLVAAGLLDKAGKISTVAQRRFAFVLKSSLPTPGVLVKGCLDSCDICETSKSVEIELDLEHKRLENELLKRQIELLDKAQEYRCCPTGANEETAEPSP
jgi:hypothetical protein